MNLIQLLTESSYELLTAADEDGKEFGFILRKKRTYKLPKIK